MAFPSIRSSATTADANGTSTVITMPSPIVAGDVLLVSVGQEGTSVVTQSGGSDWTKIEAHQHGTSGTRTLFGKIAAGGDTLTVGSTASAPSAAVAVCIQDHGVSNVAVDIMRGTSAQGTSAAPDPPQVTHGGPQDYLVIEDLYAQGNEIAGTYWSTNFSAVAFVEANDGANFASVALGQRAVSNTSENPGTMTLDISQRWLTQTYSIPPALLAEQVRVSDDFNRADTLDLAAPWEDGYSGTNNLQIVTNKLRAEALNTDSLETVTTPLADAQWGKVTVATIGGAVTAAPRLHMRMTPPSTSSGYEFCPLINAGGTLSRIGRFDAGSFTQLAASTTVGFASGDVIKGICIGTRLTMQKQTGGTGPFVSILTAVDGTYPSGRAGLNIFVATGGSLANGELDDFSAGDFLSPGLSDMDRSRFPKQKLRTVA